MAVEDVNGEVEIPLRTQGSHKGEDKDLSSVDVERPAKPRTASVNVQTSFVIHVATKVFNLV